MLEGYFSVHNFSDRENIDIICPRNAIPYHQNPPSQDTNPIIKPQKYRGLVKKFSRITPLKIGGNMAQVI
jgi:hypothetical protein